MFRGCRVRLGYSFRIPSLVQSANSVLTAWICSSGLFLRTSARSTALISRQSSITLRGERKEVHSNDGAVPIRDDVDHILMESSEHPHFGLGHFLDPQGRIVEVPDVGCACHQGKLPELVLVD